jgi:hypothetical protein
MSKLEKEIVSNLESGIENISSFEFGAPELNDMYKKLEQTIKQDFDKIPTKEIKISLSGRSFVDVGQLTLKIALPAATK